MQTMPKACIDVAYTDTTALAACVLFENWSDAIAVRELTVPVSSIEPYVPGEFFRRELPCILKVLEAVREPLDTILVDGYVWLGEKKGLGAHLFDALNHKIPVIGIAKTEFQGATPVLLPRQTGVRPLYITAAGIDPAEAAKNIGTMHGPFRIPTLLKRVDTLSRK